MLETQFWFPLLEDCTVGGGHSQVGLGERKVCIAEAMQHNLHSSHKRHFVHELVGQWQVWLGKAADVIIYRMGHPIHLFIEILFRGHPLVSIYTGHIYLHVFAYSERFSHTSSPHFLLTNFLIIFLPSPCPSSQTIGHSPSLGIYLYI